MCVCVHETSVKLCAKKIQITKKKKEQEHVNQRSNNPFRFVVDTCDTLKYTHIHTQTIIRAWRGDRMA